jgi:hypothetical protein
MKYFIKYSLILITLFTFTSCFRNPDVVYEGAAVVEFNLSIIASAPSAVATTNVANGAGEIASRINLVGKQRSSDEIIRFRVDPLRSTAVEGKHFSFPKGNGQANGDGQGVFTLPANRSFCDLSFTSLLVTPNSPGQSVILVIELLGNENIKPNENFKYHTFRILQ